MKKIRIGFGILVVLTGTACVTNQQFLAKNQPMAIQTAVTRGRFDLGCQTASGTVLSQETVQPQLMGAWGGAASGLLRGEYTIGVDGCGKRKTYVVLCPEGGTGCFAAGPGSFLDNDQQQ